MNANQLLLYGITERSYLEGITLEEAVEQALAGGVTMLQLREKQLRGDDLRKAALRIQAICRRYQVPFILDDDVTLARELDCDGVHVGQNDMPAAEARHILGPGKILGVTAKTVEQAKKAEADGADYLGSGAIFVTSTKADALPMSPETLRTIVQSVKIPVAAIGGIHYENLDALRGTGIAGVAVAGGIFNEPDIRGAAQRLREKVMTL